LTIGSSKVRRNTPIIITPKKPYTTLGIPARISVTLRRIFCTLPFDISAMKIPTATPMGTARISAPNVTYSEPTINGSIPYAGGSSVGNHSAPKRNSPTEGG